MVNAISPQELKLLSAENEKFALLDVRERNEYEQGQIFGATQVPRRLLEFRIAALIPVKSTKVILYDNDNYRSVLAAKTLERNGYTNVYYLAGGLVEWKKTGNAIVTGVHVLSKSFGEIVGEVWDIVPKMTPIEVKKILDSGEDNFIIIDVRPQEEVDKTGSIPGAICISGVELPLRVNDYHKNGKKIITTCAGRTRGYISAVTLQKMNIDNVYDLNNGTKGWKLAGFELQKEIPQGPQPSSESREKADQFAIDFASAQGIKLISTDQLQALRQNANQETLYLLDVRSAGEYEFIGHIPGSISIPGGQAIQNTDDIVAIRNGNIVFVCDNGTRAIITAYWYQQMGFPHVHVLEGGLRSWARDGNFLETGIQDVEPLGFAESAKGVGRVAVNQVKLLIDQQARLTIIDISDSKTFAIGHIPGAQWISRGWLEKQIGEIITNKSSRLIITGNDNDTPILAAVTLREQGYSKLEVLDGGTNAWRKAGYEIANGMEGFKSDDWFIPLTEYGLEQSDQYIKWEEQLAYLPEYMDYFRHKGIVR